MPQYFINPQTGRKCKVGGPTHKKLLKTQQGKGLLGDLAKFLVTKVAAPMIKKHGASVAKSVAKKHLLPFAKKKVSGLMAKRKLRAQRGTGRHGRHAYPMKKRKLTTRGRKRMMMAGTGLSVAGSGLKLAGQGRKKKRKYKTKKYAFA